VPSALVNGIKLNYVQLLDEEGGAPREDLIMVHGLATNMAFWYLKYAQEFASQFRVTLFDLRGHGRSEMPPTGYTPADLASDLAGLMDELGIRKAHFLAHSFGGVVTMNLACRQPERVQSLVLADSHISAVRHIETPSDWAFGESIQPMLDRHGLELESRDPYFGHKLLTRVAEWQVRGFAVPPELQQLAAPLLGRSGSRTALQWLNLMRTTSAETELMGDDGLTLEQLRRFKFPILAMYGDHSQARLTGAELLEVWPHAEFRRVRDAGHFFPTSKPEEVISGCQRFWRGDFAAQLRQHRAGERQRSYFRSDRVFKSDGGWYFTTRERNRIGPFEAREEARQGLASFIDALRVSA
jgi:pimeloyl-ACP methyl ester carboxylesterase